MDERKSIAHPVIRYRQNVWPAKREHEQHLHRPRANSANGGKSLYDLRVRKFGDSATLRDNASERLGGDIFDRGGLGAGQSCAAQLFVASPNDLLRRWKLCFGKQGQEAVEDRLSGIAIELLKGNRADKCLPGLYSTTWFK